MIQAYTIEKSVTITGPDFWGRDASITFSPTQKPGWWWKFGEQIDGSDVLLPIMPDMIKSKRRRLCFAHKSKVLLNIIEHITVLRMCGLDRIVISSKTQWPPYFTPAELYRELPRMPLNYELAWVNHINAGSKMMGNRLSTVDVFEGSNIAIDATIDYGTVGQMREKYHIASAGDVTDLFAKGARTQGWPREYYSVACFAKKYCNWPHIDKIAWPQRHTNGELLESFLAHRVLDVLGLIGAMSLEGSSVLACKFTSLRGGLKTDLLAFQRALNLSQ